MKRHKEVNDYSMDEASLSMRLSQEEDVHMEERSSWSPQQPDRGTEVEDSRDPHAASTLSVAASAPAMMTTMTTNTSKTTTAPSTTVMSAMSDLTYNKTSSFEHRDEQRSAFSPVQSGDIIIAPPSTTTKEAKTKQANSKQAKTQPRLPSRDQDQASTASPSTSQQDQSRQTATKSPTMPHRVVRRASQGHPEPLPFQSPSRFYQHPHQEHQEHPTPEGSTEATDAPEAAAAASASYPYQSYPGYPSYHHHPPTNTNPPTYDYHSSYYNPPPQDNRNVSSPMSSSPYHHHTPYPGYHHHQEYTSYPPGYTSHPTHHPHYSYYPSTTPSSHDQSHPHPHPAPAYSSEQHPQYYHHHHHHHHQSHQQHPPPPHHYYHPGATPPSSTSDHGTLKETSSAVTESTKGGTTPGRGMNNISGHGDSVREGLELSSPRPSYEDDRQLPPASTSDKIGGGADGTTKEDNSPSKDFEPIPLNEIAAIPALSSTTQPPSSSSSPPPYAASADDDTLPHDAYPHAFPRGTATPPSSHYFSSAISATATMSAQQQPPIQIPHHHSTPTTRRSRQQRLIAPSSSGSTASSTGEGGSWERRYTELLEFKRVHNHCEVPQNYVENTSLGTWVNKQRMEQKNRIEFKNSSLNDSRLERLQRIGFRWAKRKGQASWDEKFNELVAYKAKVGNCHVPTKYQKNTALGRWVSTQRAEYKKYQEGQAKTSMNTDKIRRLESIGFAWFMAL